MSKEVLLQHTKTGAIYITNDCHNLRNLTTEKEGTIDMVKEHLVIPLRINYMAMKNPKLIELIKLLNLAAE